MTVKAAAMAGVPLAGTSWIPARIWLQSLKHRTERIRWK